MLLNYIKHCVIFFFLLLNYSFAESIETDYKYSYGPSISQNQACAKAVEEAKKKAISNSNEILSSESIMFCDDASSGEVCKSYNTTWASSIATISKLDILEEKAGFDEETKLNFCKVTIIANLTISKGKNDPNFDFFSKLNKNTFVAGDSLEILVDTKIPIYLNIFQWQLEKNANVFDTKVIKIFPNENDKINFAKNKTYIPTKMNKKKYDFIVTFGEKKNNEDTKTEYMLILATKNNINFRNEYLLRDLKTKINEIDLSKRRERSHIYKILSN